MPKAYWIAHVDVADPVAYEAYRSANAAAFSKYGAKFLVRAGKAECVEGKARPRHVVIEFADYATAQACFHSPEYQAAIKHRLPPVGEADLVIVEGYDGPQPA